MIIHDCAETLRRDCKNLHIKDVRELQNTYNRGVADFDAEYPEELEEGFEDELHIVGEEYFQTFED
jgi:hypothetical protein